MASLLDAGLRWLPKNPALSLAKCRAKPASIRFGPKRNRKTMAWRPGPRLDPGSQPRCPPRDQRRFARAHDPEYIAMDSVRGAIRLAIRCLAGHCLTKAFMLDLHCHHFCGQDEFDAKKIIGTACSDQSLLRRFLTFRKALAVLGRMPRQNAPSQAVRKAAHIMNGSTTDRQRETRAHR